MGRILILWMAASSGAASPVPFKFLKDDKGGDADTYEYIKAVHEILSDSVADFQFQVRQVPSHTEGHPRSR